MNKKRILICGAGSIGIYLGVMLNSKNHDVELFGRRKLQEIGDKIAVNDRKFAVPKKIFSLPKNEKYDFVFITTKLYDLDSMVKQLKKSKVSASVFASIQNGLIDNKKYSKILGNKKLVPVSVFCGYQLSNKKISTHPTPLGWRTENSKEGREVSSILKNTGINCRPESDLSAIRAEKTIVNCCLNGLSAIENKPFNYLFKKEETRQRINALFYECYNILKKDYNLENPEIIKRRMYKNWENIKHYSSTCQDVHSGRNNEIKFFNGYMVQLGRKHSLPITENRKIMQDFTKLLKK